MANARVFGGLVDYQLTREGLRVETASTGTGALVAILAPIGSQGIGFRTRARGQNCLRLPNDLARGCQISRARAC